MIKFMVLSCSAVRAVCQISNGVLIMILHQVHFIGGLKSSDNRPAIDTGTQFQGKRKKLRRTL